MPAASQTEDKYIINQLAMIIFPSPYSQRAPKISFYFIFSNSVAVLPLLISLLSPVHPASPFGLASCRVLPLHEALRHPGKEESCQGSWSKSISLEKGFCSLG